MKQYLLLKIFLLAFIVAGFTISKDKTVIYTIGDSTMANKTAAVYPETGWGQVLSDFFDHEVIVKNHAVNGRSTKSFIAEKRWKAICDSLKPGDFVMIQFAHNDQKEKDSSRYTNPYTAYRKNLLRFIEETQAKGATPILLTPIVRRNFNEFGTLIDTHGPYPEVMRGVAKEKNILLIDLQMMTEEMVIRHGPEGSKGLYLHVQPGDINYPQGKEDNTHLNEKGARMVAKMVATEISRFPVSIAGHVK